MATKKPAMSSNDDSVDDFIEHVPDETRRDDAVELVRVMSQVTGEPAVMWGRSIIGFGNISYTYESGRDVETPAAAFAPRGPHQVIYLVSKYAERYGELLGQLGPHKLGVGCLYVKKLADVDVDVLTQLIDRSFRVSRGVDKQTGPVESHSKRQTN